MTSRFRFPGRRRTGREGVVFVNIDGHEVRVRWHRNNKRTRYICDQHGPATDPPTACTHVDLADAQLIRIGVLLAAHTPPGG